VKKLDKKKWVAELAQLRQEIQHRQVGMTAQEIQDEERANALSNGFSGTLRSA